MGCCCTCVYLSQVQCETYEEHNEKDLVQVKEINGKVLKKIHYYDNKHDVIILKSNDGEFYTVRIIQMGCDKLIPMYLDNGEYILYDYDTLVEIMKKKYHDDMREKIRKEVREEFSKTELLLP